MAKKLTLEQVRATAPKPNPERFREPEAAEVPEPVAAEAGSPAQPEAPRKRRAGQGRGAAPVGVSLFKDELEALDGMVDELRRAGYAPATRSLLMREAFKRLREEAEGLEGAELVGFFIRREAERRSGSS